jgi:hypothetical protein
MDSIFGSNVDQCPQKNGGLTFAFVSPINNSMHLTDGLAGQSFGMALT